MQQIALYSITSPARASSGWASTGRRMQVNLGGKSCPANLLGWITTSAVVQRMTTARLMNLDDYGIRIGNPAEVVVIDARTHAEAVAINAPVLAVFKRGKQTVFRPRAELLRPLSI